MVVVACALAGAVLLWPGRPSAGRAHDLRALAAARPSEQLVSSGRLGRFTALWNDDPVQVFQRWLATRRSQDVEAAALALLDAAGPALRAGLTPAAAVRLAVISAHGLPSDELRRFVEGLDEAALAGLPASRVWAELATRSGSGPVAFVAGAWRLSEVTGAPLAEAVERAAEALRDAQARQRRVAVAVAGPRATVFVLTALPLTGPIFGLACGLSPVELYLGSSLAAVSVVAGVVLVLLGRLWCRRLVRTAVEA
ncbi:MAG: type II secretion system F family protein [Humibacillus sp.]|nr:type II secretion system F family protein [Humibacillus sp.]MDN5779331.1 type II secretion system F family protein [Humibacillus sp.]